MDNTVRILKIDKVRYIPESLLYSLHRRHLNSSDVVYIKIFEVKFDIQRPVMRTLIYVQL